MRLLILYILLNFYSINASACSCGKSSIYNGLRGSDLVFKGKVIEIQERIEFDTIGFIHANTDSARAYIRNYTAMKFTFEVKRIYKGKLSQQNITIETTGQGSDCGNYFDLKESYLVFAYIDDISLGLTKKVTPYLTTSLCTRTKLAKKTWPNEWLIMTVARIFRKDKLIEL